MRAAYAYVGDGVVRLTRLSPVTPTSALGHRTVQYSMGRSYTPIAFLGANGSLKRHKS
jgi:hypothetical protein